MIKKIVLALFFMVLLSCIVNAQCEGITFALENIKDSGDCYSGLDIQINKPDCGYDPCFQEFNALYLELDTGIEKKLFVPRNSPATLFLNKLDCSSGKPTEIMLHLDGDGFRCSETFDLSKEGISVAKEVVDLDEAEKRVVRSKPESEFSDYWIGIGVVLIVLVAGLIIYLLVFYDRKPKYRLYRYK